MIGEGIIEELFSKPYPDNIYVPASGTPHNYAAVQTVTIASNLL
jgi:hypothetical protein